MSAAPTKLALGFGAALLALSPAIAQKAKAPAKPAAKAVPAQPTVEQLRAASDTLSLLISALNSKEVPQATKNGLFLCLYGNPLGKISRGQTLALAAGKAGEAATPTQRLLILVDLCDAPSPGSAGPAAAEAVPAEGAPADTPKPTKKQPEGR